jgi:signal transduction histidine kinase
MSLWPTLRWVRALAVFQLMACLTMQVRAELLELRHGRADVTVHGQTHSQAIELPYHWDRLQKGEAGAATFELHFDLERVPDENLGLYIPRLGNAYEIWLNGRLLERRGDLLNFNGADFAKTPRYIVIAPDQLRTRNLIRVDIRADVGRRGGLAPLFIGPAEQTYALYLTDYRWRSTGSLAVVIVSLLVGLISLALWSTQVDLNEKGLRRRDSLYLFAALAELSWTISVGNAIIENPPLPWPWWGVLMHVALTVWVCSMVMFCVEVANWGRLPVSRGVRRWLATLLAASVFASIGALAYGYPLAMTLMYATLGLTSLTFAACFVWMAARRGTPPQRMVAVLLLGTILIGLRDLYVFRVSQEYGGNTLIRYSSVLFGLALGYIVIMRFRAASGQARDFNVKLAARVALKEQELSQSYVLLEQLARKHERSAERTRILRDMHDGVGSHISAAIRQLQSGKTSNEQLLQTLRDSLDQLKLSIDALHLPPGDITGLLANLRYRMEPRIQACDIELQWDVDLLPVLERLDEKAMRQLQFMVFEAVSNVMQHARAKMLRVELRASPRGGAVLRLIDNGRGFDPDRVKLRGLGSLRERAAALGAELQITSAPGQTMVEITLDP